MTLQDLLDRALVIYNETVDNMNSNTRVGSLFRDLANWTNFYFAVKGDTESTLSQVEESKVDKIAGKELSSNDYTDEDKALVGTIKNKVDKIAGKGLSSNDYTNEDKLKILLMDTGELPGYLLMQYISLGNEQISLKNKIKTIMDKLTSLNSIVNPLVDSIQPTGIDYLDAEFTVEKPYIGITAITPVRLYNYPAGSARTGNGKLIPEGTERLYKVEAGSKIYIQGRANVAQIYGRSNFQVTGCEVDANGVLTGRSLLSDVNEDSATFNHVKVGTASGTCTPDMVTFACHLPTPIPHGFDDDSQNARRYSEASIDINGALVGFWNASAALQFNNSGEHTITMRANQGKLQSVLYRTFGSATVDMLTTIDFSKAPDLKGIYLYNFNSLFVADFKSNPLLEEVYVGWGLNYENYKGNVSSNFPGNIADFSMNPNLSRICLSSTNATSLLFAPKIPLLSLLELYNCPMNATQLGDLLKDVYVRAGNNGSMKIKLKTLTGSNDNIEKWKKILEGKGWTISITYAV